MSAGNEAKVPLMGADGGSDAPTPLSVGADGAPAASANIFARAWNYFTPKQQQYIIIATGALLGAGLGEGGERLAQHYAPMPTEAQSVGSEVALPVVGAIAGAFLSFLAMNLKNSATAAEPAPGASV